MSSISVKPCCSFFMSRPLKLMRICFFSIDAFRLHPVGMLLGEIRQPISLLNCHNLMEIIADVVALYHTADVRLRYTLCKVAAG